MSDDRLLKSLTEKIEMLRGDPNEMPLAKAGKNEITTNKISLKTRNVLKGHFAKVYAINWGNNKRLVSASQDGKMIIWDASTANKIVAVPLKSSWVMTCAFSPSEKLLACGGLDNTCSIFSIENAASGGEAKIQVKELIGHEGYISCLRFFDDEKLISSSGDSTCVLWDLPSKKAVSSFEGHEADVMSVSIKKTSNLFASGSCDATAKIYDTRDSKRAVMTFAGHESDINSVSFVADMDCLVTGSDDSSCRLFDLRSRKQLNKYVSDNILCGITSVASSKGGKYLFAGYDDYNIYGWHIITGEPSMTTVAHDNRVSCLDVSRDGMALATGSWDTFVKIWA